MSFDLISYFEERGISFSTSGPNTSQGWINTSCPFCDDTSNHLGINLESLVYSCWKCSEKGHISKYIQYTENIPKKQVYEILKEFGGTLYKRKPIVREEKTSTTFFFPKTATKDFHKLHLRYLKKRRYDPKDIIEKYDLYCCTNLGNYKWRIVVPIFMSGNPVSFTTVDITGSSNIKYKHCPKEKSVVAVKNAVYNIDSVDSIAIIVEGVFDCWRIGSPAIALFGKKHTTEQLKAIRNLNLKKAFVMLDSDAIREATKLCNTLSEFVPHVEIMEIRKGDPDDLSEETVKDIRKKLGLKEK